MKYVTEPVLGGDGKTAVMHSNTYEPLTSVSLQGKSSEGLSHHDGERSMDRSKGRNVYFNDKMDTSGEL